MGKLETRLVRGHLSDRAVEVGFGIVHRALAGEFVLPQGRRPLILDLRVGSLGFRGGKLRRLQIDLGLILVLFDFEQHPAPCHGLSVPVAD